MATSQVFRNRIMLSEVHVHGTLDLCKGVTLGQVENGLRKWLEYMDVETISEASSLEPEEPGIVFDSPARTLEICWTGEVGNNFVNHLQDALRDIGPLTAGASHIELTYFHEDGRDEHQLLFTGPSAAAIHLAQRRQMLEDVASLLSRHFGAQDVAQVTDLVNVLFDRDMKKLDSPDPDLPPTGANLLPFRKKHLH
jgi:hypothetical protein